jgi:hypothetical protein
MQFYRRTISAIFTESYASVAYKIFPEVNNRLRERCRAEHQRCKHLTRLSGKNRSYSRKELPHGRILR